MEDRLEDEMKISLQRLEYLKMTMGGNLSDQEIDLELIAGGPPRLFFVPLYIGMPPKEQLLAMDTGSSLLWVVCYPWEICDRNRSHTLSISSSLYDYRKSDTYVVDDEQLRCNSSYCINMTRKTNSCGGDNECIYIQEHYKDNSSIYGFLMKETFTTTNYQPLENVISGCSQYACLKDEELAIGYHGVLGLGAGEISLVSQLGEGMFSYCIGDLYDKVSDDNKLVIGEPLINSDNSIPLIVDDNHYYVNMIGISVGDKLLKINREELVRNTEEKIGGAVIDTGSTMDLLLPAAYKALKDEVVKLLSGLVRAILPTKYDLCYEGSVRSRKVRNFPRVKYHFEGGATLELTANVLFRQVNQMDFCLVLGNAANYGYTKNFIGVHLQQFTYTAYDLNRKSVSFQRVNCSKIE